MSYQTVEKTRWASAIEQGTFGVWDLDPGLEVVHYASQWKARLGFPRIDAPDSAAFWRCRVHPDDFSPMLESLRSHLDGNAKSYAMQFRLRSNGAGYRTMLSRGRVVARDALGNATRMIGTMVDLTGRVAPAANHGLAAETQGPAGAAPRVPFHAVLGVARPGIEGELGVARENHQLVERIDDLLDMALREGGGAR